MEATEQAAMKMYLAVQDMQKHSKSDTGMAHLMMTGKVPEDWEQLKSAAEEFIQCVKSSKPRSCKTCNVPQFACTDDYDPYMAEVDERTGRND